MTITTAQITLLNRAIYSAQINWTGPDWRHEYQVKGIYSFDSHGDHVHCEGGSKTCDTCSFVSNDAKEAYDLGKEALTILNSDNDLTLEDLQSIEELLRMASSVESYWGDNPHWGIPLEIIEELND
tara:strand:- start:1823 stop:2200 length:378 start_codon:yes stop_codon:yes gene_type:complete